MPRTDFAERRERRQERYEHLSDKNTAESERRFETADNLASVIPMGQPILVGHHSERGHRAHLKKIRTNMDKGVEAAQKAKYYERRADAVKNNTAIFSDDPNATEKLADKITRLEEQQKLMVAFNKALRKKDTEAMLDLGFTEVQITRLSVPDWAGRVGYPNYVLTNNGANIRRLKERLAAELKAQQDITTEKTIGDIRILDNVEENRLQIFFQNKPADEVRAKLKSRGFRWSPTSGAWQRHRSSQANYYADQIATSLNTNSQ